MNDELIVRVLSGTASPLEGELLRVWRRKEPQNEAYYQETVRAWVATEPPPSVPSDAREFARSIIEAADRRSAADAPFRQGAEPSVRRSTAWSLRRGVALAATVAAIALGIRIMSRSARQDAVAVWEADAGRSRTLALGDGSLVRIAPGSRLVQLDSRDERRFTLQGRAFFAVAHDAAHPFVVESGPVEVRDLGTRFEVDGTGDVVRAVVVEGRVALSGPKGSVAVAAGGVGTVSRDRPPTIEYPRDVHDLLDWPDGVLVFQATPLYEVADEVSRHFGRTVTLEDTTIRSRRISAWFGPEDFKEVMDAVCNAAAVACSVSDSTAIVRGR